MGPQELAALVAREADAGVAGALRAFDSAGALTVETIVGRIGSRPAAVDTPWEDVVWLAEVVMRPSGTVRDVPSESSEPPVVDVPALVGRLAVSALRGVGPRWAARLEARGVRTLGDLASTSPATVAAWAREEDGGHAVQLVARARECAVEWPRVDPSDTRSVLEVSESDPGQAAGWPPGSRAEAHALWAACLRLRAAIDDEVLDRVGVNVD